MGILLHFCSPQFKLEPRSPWKQPMFNCSLSLKFFFFQGSVGVVGIAGGKGQTVRLLSSGKYKLLFNNQLAKYI